MGPAADPGQPQRLAAVSRLNEPAQWSEQGTELMVTADAATDFWRITGYGCVRDSGHLYGEVLAGDFDLSMPSTTSR
jgi:regulation of enolase protein 1 (concanavalin A-like superfamily)